MKYSRVVMGPVMLVGWLLLLSPAASAQQASGIAGVVRDTSGAVLPGVTVEGSSPALIEKTRTAVTDSEGRYNLVDLRPGTYQVTFTLPGFNTVRREGIELTGGFTATVNADLQVGSLEETITVTGASPLVDTQNVRQQTIVSDELLSTLPSGSKGYVGVARLIPGLSGGADSGGATGIYYANFVHQATIHGKGGAKMTYDGMQTGNLAIGGNLSYITNPAMVEETMVESGGISAESNASGLVMNLIPKEGSNTLRFGADVTYTNRHLQSDNLTDTLRSRGLTTTKRVQYLYDTNVSVGGPVKQDRLWFIVASRFSGTKNDNPGVFFNSTQGTPFYTPDLNRPAYSKEWLRSTGGRMTWQISPKHKLSGFADVQSFQLRGTGDNAAPEAHTAWSFWPAGLFQVTWNSPLTNKLLLEAGVGLGRNGFPYTREQTTDIFGFTVDPTDVTILEASTGFRYNAKSNYYDKNQQDRYSQRFAASYVTGSHAYKVGIQVEQHVFNQDYVVNSALQYTFLRGVPSQLTQWAQPLLYQARTKADLGIYAQDKWTIKRMTVNYGVRLDYFNAYVPETHLAAGEFVGARDFDAVQGLPRWTDLNPRVGTSYDLFGDGRTALKTSIGRYVGKMATAAALAVNPLTTSVNSVNRSWNDVNRNFVPDCDLRNNAANGECGTISNLNFGQFNPSAIQYDDDLLRGFGVRDYFWDFTAEVQHQLGPRVSVTGGYYRNWTDHFGADGLQSLGSGVMDNLAQTPADFDPYCVTAPVDSRLPGGGGYQVCGLYDVNPAKFGQGQVLVRRPEHYGDGKSRVSDFFTGSFSTRFGGGVEFGGSVDTGRTVEDRCFVVDSPQELLNCRTVTPFGGQTQYKLYGSLPLKGGLLVSGVFQNVSGVTYEANFAVPNSVIAPSLGRNLSACGTQTVCTATVMVPLILPRAYFEPRRTLLDLRVSKIFSLGSQMRLRANLDVYNVTNEASAVTLNNTYGATWRRPTGSPGMTAGRLVQFGGQLNF